MGGVWPHQNFLDAPDSHIKKKKKIFGEGLQARLAYLVYTAYTGRTLHIKRSILCSYNEDTCVTYE